MDYKNYGGFMKVNRIAILIAFLSLGQIHTSQKLLAALSRTSTNIGRSFENASIKLKTEAVKRANPTAEQISLHAESANTWKSYFAKKHEIKDMVKDEPSFLKRSSFYFLGLSESVGYITQAARSIRQHYGKNVMYILEDIIKARKAGLKEFRRSQE